MYELNDKKQEDKPQKKCTKRVRVAKECAYLAVFVALLIAVQLVLAIVPGVELVTVLFVSYAFVFGWRRGMLAATTFALLRQLIFGIYPVVLLLYLIYFNLLGLAFGVLGAKIKKATKNLPLIVGVACMGTACFAMLDNFLTPLIYGYSWRALQVYFYASLSVMFPQILCTAGSVAFLFLPLTMVFSMAKKRL